MSGRAKIPSNDSTSLPHNLLGIWDFLGMAYPTWIDRVWIGWDQAWALEVDNLGSTLALTVLSMSLQMSLFFLLIDFRESSRERKKRERERSM